MKRHFFQHFHFFGGGGISEFFFVINHAQLLLWILLAEIIPALQKEHLKSWM